MRVAESSHMMSHEDQFLNDVTNDQKKLQLVAIRQGQFIIFHRNLLHQGVSYETEHSRVFAYAEIYPKGAAVAAGGAASCAAE